MRVLPYPRPPLAALAKGQQVEDFAKLINDGFADICEKYSDYFPGWVAEAPLAAPDAGVREVTRALENGALGAQIHTNIAGRPLDDPEFEPFFETMNKL